MKPKHESLVPYCRPVLFEEPLRVIPPFNWVGHLPFAFWIVDILKPRSIVELGAHAGVSYFGFCQAVKSLELPTACYAVDTWKGDPQSGFYGEDIFQAFSAHNQKHYSSFSRMLRETFDEARPHFEPGSIDLLHIDGYHTYDAVKHDFENWLPTLSDRAVVLLHDVNVHEADFGTVKLWEELKAKFPHFTFLHSHGLGVLVTGTQMPEPLQALVKTEKEFPELVAQIRDYFSTLGTRITEKATTEAEKNAQIAARGAEVENLRAQIHKLQEIAHNSEHERKQLASLQTQLRTRNAEFDDLSKRFAIQDEKLRKMMLENASMGLRLYDGLRAGNQQSRKSARLSQKIVRVQQELNLLRQSLPNRIGSRVVSTVRRAKRAQRACGEFLRSVPSIFVGNFQARYTERKNYGIIRQSRLFDSVYYVRSNPAIKEMKIDPILHFLRSGSDLSSNPNALFDVNYYLATYPDVAAAEVNPFVHYVTIGAAEGRNPSPLFNTHWYCQQSGIDGASGINPLSHYLNIGRFAGQSPCPLFDVDYYLMQNPDVAIAGVDPLTHFISDGGAEDRDPHPLFDTSYYRLDNSDLVESRLNPLAHYILRGGHQGLNPHLFFDTSYYLEHNPAAVQSEFPPLAHYLLEGWRYDADPHPLFDSLYYRNHAPGIGSNEIPLAHFVEFGLNAGLNPHPTFDSSFYYTTYPDVALSRMPPFEHFARHGCVEGRMGTCREIISYPNWIAEFRALSGRDRATIDEDVIGFAKNPRISVLINLDGHLPKPLVNTVESVFAQIYPNWNLIFLAPEGLSSETRELLNKWSKDDSRVAVYPSAEGSFSFEPLNEGLRHATGDFVTVLDNGACLADEAFYLIAKRVQAEDNIKIFYGDTDRLDESGERWHPFFKPEWDPFLFYELDYVSGFTVYDRKFVTEQGGFRPGLNGATEFDLILRSLEGTTSPKIVHLPFVAAHMQRAIPPTVQRTRQQTSPVVSRIRALTEHFERTRIHAKIQPARGGRLCVSYSLPETLPLVSLIIPTRDRVKLLRACITSILEKTTYPNFEIVVVDNDSIELATQDYFAQLESNPRVRVVPYHGTFNYSAMNNAAVKEAKGEVIGFVNNDIEVISPNWLSNLVSSLSQPGVASVGAKLYYPDDAIQHAGVIIGKNGVAGHIGGYRSRYDCGPHGIFSVTRQLSAVTAACMLMWKRAFEQVRGFNEESFTVAFNDIDLCLRVREQNGKILFVPTAELYHHESASRGPETNAARRPHFERECINFRERWNDILDLDPFYSPNLSLGPHDYELATPPRAANPWSSFLKLRFNRDEHRDPRLDPYATAGNFTRSQEATGKPTKSRNYAGTWKPGLSVVILNLNKPEYINPLLDSLVEAKRALAQESMEIEIIVGDTGSTDPQVLGKYEALTNEITVQRGLKYQFSACNNQMFERLVMRENVLFLNNDIVFSDATATLREALKYLNRHSEAGILGSYLFYPDGKIQHAGIEFFREGPLRGLCYHVQHGQEILAVPEHGSGICAPAVTGAWLMIRSSLFATLGGFDEHYSTECQDVALCLATRRLGFESHLIYAGHVVHLENGTRDKGSEDWGDRQRFIRKWESFVEAM